MPKSTPKKKKNVPGILVKCESGRYLAYYEHRTDIIANGENEKDAMRNLKEMYQTIIQVEDEEEKEKEIENKSMDLLPNVQVKKFTEKLSRI